MQTCVPCCRRFLQHIAASMAILSLIAGYSVCRAYADDNAAVKSQTDPGSIHVDPAQDWPWWRGITHDGIANPDQHPPVQWSESENVVWKIKLPGRSHGSPIVVGDQVVVTAADSERNVQTILCFDRTTGQTALGNCCP